MNEPFLTSAIEPVDCEYKRVPTDFIVEEIPAFEPTGEGQHLWMRIEKRGMTTDAALGRLASCLGVERRKLRVGGKKDARAVTLQWVSLDLPPADFELRLGDLGARGGDSEVGFSVLEITRHRTALGLGRTHGNRFRIKLRELDSARHADVESVLSELGRRGVPNYFGEQRFGHRGDTDHIGEAIMAGQNLEAVQQILGRPMDVDTGRWLVARQAFESGDLEAAKDAWTRSDFAPRQLLKSMLKGDGEVTEESAKTALATLDNRDLGFFGSAFQARLFNAVLARRIDSLDQVWLGDLALRLPGGRQSFPIEDLAAEQGRAAAGEISATGPLFGPKMPCPRGEAAELEQLVLEEAGWSHEGFGQSRNKLWPGGRRALRIALLEPESAAGQDDQGPFFELRFSLPKGSYATSVLRELHKRV